MGFPSRASAGRRQRSFAGTATPRRGTPSTPTATSLAPRWAEIVEQSFAHNLERGGLRRTWLRGRENVHKRYLIHVAGHNLGILMRLLIGAGTPKEVAARGRAFLFVNYRDDSLAIVVLFLDDADPGILVVTVTAEPT